MPVESKLDLAPHEWVEAHAARDASAIAVSCGAREIAYRDLDDLASAVARHLRQAGVGPETPVGMLLEPSIEMVAAALAVWKVGGACLAVTPRDAVAHALSRATPLTPAMAALVTETRYTLPAIDSHVARIDLDRLGSSGCEGIARSQAPWSRPHAEQLACIIPDVDADGAFAPVMLPHRALSNYADWMRRALPPAEHECLLMAIHGRAAGAAAWELCVPLMIGAHLHIASAYAIEHPDALIETIAGHRVTTLVTTPAVLRRLVEEGGLRHCRALRRVLCRIEPLPADVCEALLSQVEVELCTSYGVDGAVDVAWWRCDAVNRGATNRGAREPIGRPIDRTQIYILDTHGRLVPPGIAGELYVGGASLGRGYWNDPRSTAACFVPSPFSKSGGARLLRTGQRARWRADGCVEHLGRVERRRHARAVDESVSAAPAAPRHSPPRTEIERLLLEIWKEILAIDRVGIHDDFFDLGGDSILSMQVVAKAARHGVKLRVRHIFEHRTIAAVAGVATPSAESPPRDAAAHRAPSADELPLTPIQHQFFEQRVVNPHHYNQAIVIAISGWTFPRIEALASRWLETHDALRLRYRRHGDTWTQTIAARETHRVATHVDLSAVPPGDWRPLIERESQTLQQRLHLADGPLLRLAYFHGGAAGDRLLIVIHHLAIDAVSWRRLLAMRPGEAAETRRDDDPAGGSSFREWAEGLVRYAQTPAVAADAPYWLALASQTIPSLPVDDPRGANTMRLADTVSIVLGADETRRLREQLPALRVSMHELLLTALAEALARWTGETRFRLDIEGHGREDLLPGIDVSQTVGWFTAIFPLVIDVPTRATTGSTGGPRTAAWREVLDAVAAQVRRGPRGLGYGLLRYLRDDPALRASLAAVASPISFNYLGQFEQGRVSDSDRHDDEPRFGEESPGFAQSPDDPRTHELQCTATIAGMTLRVQMSYSRARYRRATMTALVERIRDTLIGVIEDGRAAAHAADAPGGGVAGSGESVEDLLVDLHSYGSGPPLFCVAPYGDAPAMFRDLARELNTHHGVYGLAVPADRDFSYRTLARRHVDAIKRTRRGGPYVLAGYSLGGLVAFEIASQLEAAGDDVMLMLFETVCPAACIDVGTLSDTALFERIVRRLDPDLTWADDLASAPEQERLTRMHAAAHARPGLTSIIPDLAGVRAFLDIWRRRADYVPGRFTGPAALFRTSDMSVLDAGFTHAWAREGDQARTLGWRDTAGTLTVVDAPGAHANFLFPPHVRHVARRVRSWLHANAGRLPNPAR